MTPSKPYLIRALREWIIDNQCTPHLLAKTNHEGIEIPQGYAQNNQIVLNISEQAVVNFGVEHIAVAFWARFGGVEQRVWIPMGAIVGIYARETGEGMQFAEEPQEPPKNERPSLKVVK